MRPPLNSGYGEKATKSSHKSRYARLAPSLLVLIVVVIIAVFTGGIAYSVQLLGGGEVVEGTLVDGVKEIKLRAAQWDFLPAAIKAEPGDRIRFVVTSSDISHGFAINELGMNLALEPRKALTEGITIPRDIAEGIYTMYCSIFCGIGHPYMKGRIIIGTPVQFMGVGLEKILPYASTVLMAGLLAAFVFVVKGRHTA